MHDYIMSSEEIAHSRKPCNTIDRGTFRSANAAVGYRAQGSLSNVGSKYIYAFGGRVRLTADGIQVDEEYQSLSL